VSLELNDTKEDIRGYGVLNNMFPFMNEADPWATKYIGSISVLYSRNTGMSTHFIALGSYRVSMDEYLEHLLDSLAPMMEKSCVGDKKPSRLFIKRVVLNLSLQPTYLT
jgi:hypothetical protein